MNLARTRESPLWLDMALGAVGLAVVETVGTLGALRGRVPPASFATSSMMMIALSAAAGGAIGGALFWRLRLWADSRRWRCLIQWFAASVVATAPAQLAVSRALGSTFSPGLWLFLAVGVGFGGWLLSDRGPAKTPS